MNTLLGLRVFSATRAKDRVALGDVITDWIRDNPANEIVEAVQVQSSDAQFHCVTIVIFFRYRVIT